MSPTLSYFLNVPSISVRVKGVLWAKDYPQPLFNRSEDVEEMLPHLLLLLGTKQDMTLQITHVTACMYVHICSCLYVSMSVHVHACLYVHIRLYVNMYMSI